MQSVLPSVAGDWPAELLVKKMNAVQIKKMMILNFIKYIAEIKIRGLTAECHVADVFIKFVVMR